MLHRRELCTLAVLVGLFVPGAALAQVDNDKDAMNSVFIEGLGPGGMYSMNYERLLHDDVGVRIGASYISVGASAGDASAKSTMAMFPITASYIGLRSDKGHALEAGGGASIVFLSAQSSAGGSTAEGSGVSAVPNVLVGYRFQPRKGGFQFRIGASGFIARGAGAVGIGAQPTTSNPAPIGFLPWGYISLGGSF